MSAVLVQHRRHRRRADVADGPESADAVRRSAYWSLWGQRHFPWALLAEGERVLLLDSWSSGSRLTWLVEARDVLRASVSSRQEAVTVLSDWMGEPSHDVEASDYLRGSTVESGVVLGWRPSPLAWLGAARPDGLRVERNGWAVARTEDLDAWGVDLTP
ncbi:hypothetical protein [Mumia zhuanghuii]|uniref:Uncharacterized protein n=1 Tax=Mumia zhuanghuii TaxID=2585211 RepID=A0A5C4MZA9_9ACTN|nr:hypothetical protein [Mumia zhuanghuii]TNC49509.1 hypothetical protein FHE65_05360 [Mumia zhuanghuii]TNC49649.1 hypothetical protein FHE65_05060 [Mumia zhuanghuii]